LKRYSNLPEAHLGKGNESGLIKNLANPLRFFLLLLTKKYVIIMVLLVVVVAVQY